MEFMPKRENAGKTRTLALQNSKEKQLSAVTDRQTATSNLDRKVKQDLKASSLKSN